MRILALDTATEACTAAVLTGDQCWERGVVQARGHGEQILGLVDRVLGEAGIRPQDLDAVAFGRGPGAFTGIRIAIGVAQGIGFGLDLPVLPVSNLAALAQRLYREQGRIRLLPALDARMGEVYFAAYQIEAGIACLVGEEQVGTPANLTLPPGTAWHGVGRGWASHAVALHTRLGVALASVTPEQLCQAQDIAHLGAAAWQRGAWVHAEAALPVYLRDRVTRL